MAIYLGCGRIGHESELRFFKAMTRELPPDWIVLGNPTILYKKNTVEIDAIILSPSSLWGIELKSWGGPIKADASKWLIPDINNPYPGKFVTVRSPLKLITEKMKSHLEQLGTSILARQVWVQSIVVMMKGDGSNFKMECEGRDRIVFFRDVKKWLLQDERQNQIRLHKTNKAEMPDRHLLQRLLVNINGEHCWASYNAGGDIVPDKMDAPGANLVFIISQQGFQRCYYSNELSRICLNKAEIRGASPDNWKDWHAEGAYIDFTEDGIMLETLPGISLEVNGNNVAPGRRINLDIKSGTLILGGIAFTYRIEKE